MRVICILVIFAFGTSSTLAGQDDYGIEAFRKMRENSPEKFCKYITCHENEEPDECPEGTSYMPGVAQFGCCGACVQFKQREEKECTGSIDPRYGGYNSANPKSLRESISGSEAGARSGAGSGAGAISDTLPENRNTLSSSWCDYFLKCDKSACVDAESGDKGCKYIQSQYDKFLADPEPDPVTHFDSAKYVRFRDDYIWRPNCTADNEFEVKQCKGPTDEERCVCVDPSGNRIFGSAFPFQEELYNTMNCACSKKVWELQQAGASSVTLHCTENGNYEPLQCEDGWCYCIDPITTETYGPNLPESAMALLPCYKKEEIGEQYLRRCESEFHAFAVLSDLLKEKGVQAPSSNLHCDPDGSYGPIQYIDKMYYCCDKYYKIIWNPAGDGCQCDRDAETFKDYGIKVDCRVDSGRYTEIQQRGQTVYCADDDGVRTGPRVYEEYKTYLECQSSIRCQAGITSNCQNSCVSCPPEAYTKYQ
ncbi:uncharacterized protein [Palaemon carinicauda]|uniref:uncharacterized protein isoform X2 n=1 Tax=Palaemon carinicauda TaxID=392227 RepID=UPI0035B5D712